MKEIVALVFNSGTFKRSDLEDLTSQQLYDLYKKHEQDAQVVMYYLDDFSCAFNNEDVSDQDWLYFIDLNDIKTDEQEEDKKKVWVMTQESKTHYDVIFNVIVCDSEQAALKEMEREKEWIAEESYRFKDYDPNDDSLVIEECEHRFFIMDEGGDYYEEIKVEEKEIVSFKDK